MRRRVRVVEVCKIDEHRKNEANVRNVAFVGKSTARFDSSTPGHETHVTNSQFIFEHCSNSNTVDRSLLDERKPQKSIGGTIMFYG